MTSKRISNIINRPNDTFGSVMFHSEDISGLDEALEKAVYQKERFLQHRRGPVIGIADNDLLNEIKFELAEDVACNKALIADNNTFPNQIITTSPSSMTYESSSDFPNMESDSGQQVLILDKHCTVNTEKHNTENNKSRYRYRNSAFGFIKKMRTNLSSRAPRRSLSLSNLEPLEAHIEFQRLSTPDLFSMNLHNVPYFGWPNEPIDIHPVSFVDSSSDSSLNSPCGMETDKTDMRRNESIKPIASFQPRHPEVKTPDNVQISNNLEALKVISQTPTLFTHSSVINSENDVIPAYIDKMENKFSPQCMKKRKPKQSHFFFKRFKILASVIVALISICWTLSVSSFVWGILVGSFLTYCIIRVYNLIIDFLFTTSKSSDMCCLTSPTVTGWFNKIPYKAPFCCSLHNPDLSTWRPPYGPLIPPSDPTMSALPAMRELSSPIVPQLSDEDVKSGPTSGPLSESLGYRIDKNDHPIYKAWMNEIISYSPEIYHINSTHSVYVTLEGTKLRIQRPKKNVPRRSMINVSLPSASTVQFVHQRIFEMTDVKVELLPVGLVEKRLWSKKYPICLKVNQLTIESSTDKVLGLRLSRNSSDLSEGRQFHRQTSSSLSNISKLKSQSVLNTTGVQFPRVSTNASSSSQPTPKEDEISVNDSSKSDFCIINHSDVDESVYLFARTCREKEAWFRRLHAASEGKPLLTTIQQSFNSLLASSSQNPEARDSPALTVRSNSIIGLPSSSSLDAEALGNSPKQTFASSSSNIPSKTAEEEVQQAYLSYMAKFMPAEWIVRAARAMKLNLNYIVCDSQVLWLNAFIGRVFWDFMRHEYWANRVQEKIQAKLKKLHLPYFINELTISSMSLGKEIPVIRRIGKPFIDNHGLWMEAEMIYNGGFSMIIATNINLAKFRERFTPKTDQSDRFVSVSSGKSSSPKFRRSFKLAAYRTDEEDSADSTTDSECEPDPCQAVGFTSPFPNANIAEETEFDIKIASAISIPSLAENRTPGSVAVPQDDDLESSFSIGKLQTKKRLSKLVDRITRSSYFQKAVDTKFVQRGMDYISNKPINLQLEISMLYGTLVINIPPPPSDRLWYGFRGNPTLRFKLRPKVGEKMVTIPRLIEILEKKLLLEFQRVVVLPNMDDIVIPLLIPENSLVPGYTGMSDNPYDSTQPK